MTDAEALALAIAKWGSAAILQVERLTLHDGSSFERYAVGHLGHEAFSWAACGVGSCWELAFADSEQREHARRMSTDPGCYAQVESR